MKDYTDKQREHLERMEENITKKNDVPCLHDNCSECLGTGRKVTGECCIHMISCPCPKCSPHNM